MSTPDPHLAHLTRLAARLLTAYDLPEVQISPIRTGNNAVFRVAQRQGAGWVPLAVLRLHRPAYRTPAQSRSELHYLASLCRHAPVSVPRPIAARTGEMVVVVDDEVTGGTCHGDLLHWLPGRVRRPGTGLGLRLAQRLGAALGHLHRHAEGFAPPPGFDLPRWDADALLSERSPFRPGPLDSFLTLEEVTLFERLHGRVAALFAVLGESPANVGVIHADFILGNCLFHGHTPQVIDFDDCGWGFYLYDLAPILGNFSDYPHARALTRAFLAGYRSVRLLPEAHERHFPLLIATRHATSALWAAGRILGGALPTAEVAQMQRHIAYRITEVRAALAMAP